MIGFYNYTVILTYVGVCFGMLGIYAAAYGDIRGAMVCLLASGFCDLFDGRIARTKQRTDQEKRFGIQIDSLADLVDFGALPAVIGFQLGLEGFRAFLLCLYVLAALIRLAYFNVTEDELQIGRSEKRVAYDGLPVTTAALIFPMIYAAAPLLGSHLTSAYGIAMTLVAAAFVIPFRIQKPKTPGVIVMSVVGALVSVLIVFGH